MDDVPAGKVDVLIRARMDEAKLDRYVRELYDDDETIPGEPRVGLHLIRDLVDENTTGKLDPMWLEPNGNPYVDSFVIAVIPGG